MENKNKEGDKDILEGEDNVKFCTVRPTKSFGHAERIQNQRIPKQPAKKKKRGMPRKLQKDEFEERW